MNDLVNIAATVATVAAGVIVAGYILSMFGDAPFLRDAKAGLA